MITKLLTTPEGVEAVNSKFICKFSAVLKGKIMSTYTQFLYQLVFSSKDHIPFLSGKNQAEHHKTISYKEELSSDSF